MHWCVWLEIKMDLFATNLSTWEAADSDENKRQDHNNDKKHPKPWPFIGCFKQVTNYSSLDGATTTNQ